MTVVIFLLVVNTGTMGDMIFMPNGQPIAPGVVVVSSPEEARVYLWSLKSSWKGNPRLFYTASLYKVTLTDDKDIGRVESVEIPDIVFKSPLKEEKDATTSR